MRETRMWRVTFASRRFGQQYFSASVSAAGLGKATAELARRRELMRREGALKHSDRVERNHKTVRTGRPGVMFNWCSRDRAFFEAKASSRPYGRTLRFSLRGEECVDPDSICRIWALAVATRDYLGHATLAPLDLQCGHAGVAQGASCRREARSPQIASRAVAEC